MVPPSKAQYEREGYWIVRGLHSAAQARDWKSLLSETVSANPDPSGVKVWLSEELPDFLLAPMTHRATAEVLKEIVGSAVEFLSVKAVFKNPQVDFASPWHHDWFYWGGIPKISIWIALDDASPENGCLKVIPGSHLQDFPLSKVESEKGFGNRIEDSLLEGLPWLSLPAKAGDAIFFSDRLVHSSHPNTSKKDRWSLISTYRSSATPDSSTVWKATLPLP